MPKGKATARQSTYQWTDEELALLGRFSDSEVARRLGVQRTTVKRKRTLLGIPPAGGERKNVNWTPDKVALLGTMPDSQVAAHLAVASSTVAQRRNLLGIPAAGRPRIRADWTPDRETLLGTMPDGEVATRLGVHVTTVRRRRRLLGIPAWSDTPQVRPGGSRLRHQWTDEEAALLGQIPDSELAARLGLAHNTVKKAREARGLPLCPGWGQKISGWTPERDALLGTMTDAALARRLGVAQTTVNHRRQQLGIAAFRATRRHTGMIGIDGAKIKALRQALGKSKRALAGANHTLATHLGTIESGQVRSVRPATLQKLCELLGCKPEDISRGETTGEKL